MSVLGDGLIQAPGHCSEPTWLVVHSLYIFIQETFGIFEDE